MKFGKKMKALAASGVVLLGASLAHADLAAIETAATTQITTVVTSATAIVVAGFAITGVIWGARRLRSALHGA